MYHRIATPGVDPWELSVSPQNFAGHLEVLAHLGPCLTLAGLWDEIAQDAGARRAIAITLDDGYRDNHAVALPMLRAAGLPATVFVTSGTIGSDQEFWWDVLTRAIMGADRLPDRLTFASGSQIRTFSAGARRRASLLHQIARALMSLPPEAVATAVSGIAAQTGVDRAGSAGNHPMALAELRSLAASGQVEIGGHTRTHAALPRIPADAAAREIREGRAALRDWTGQGVDSFAAPFGLQDAAVIGAVRDAGFARSCEVRPGLVTTGTDPFRIPRIHVPDMTADRFEQFVRELVGS